MERAGRRAPGLLRLLASTMSGLVLICVSGCAGYAVVAGPEYGRAWETFAAQAGTAAPAPPVGAASIPRLGPKLLQTVESIPQARQALREAETVLKARSPSRERIEGAAAGLAEIERQVRERIGDDPRALEEVRGTIEELRRRIDEKLLEISRIEPGFDVGSRGSVRVAVVRIGEGVGTIRPRERALWCEFLARAGFHPDPVFIPPFLAGREADAAAVRVAAARLGAKAVLAYATFSATTAGPFEESAAVLSFAKCMFVDVRTEYLYFNAEGECRDRRVGLPFTVCSLCLEEDCLFESVKALRGEILHELERLERE